MPRRIEERIENEYAMNEAWEPSARHDVRALSDEEIKRLVRRMNAAEKRNGSSVRFRSVEDEF